MPLSVIHRRGWNRRSRTPCARGSAQQRRHGRQTARKVTSLARRRSAISPAGPSPRFVQSLLNKRREIVVLDSDIYRRVN